MHKQEAVALSIRLGREMITADNESMLCTSSPPFFTVANLEEIIIAAEKENDFVAVRRYIGEVLGHGEALNYSFLEVGLCSLCGITLTGV